MSTTTATVLTDLAVIATLAAIFVPLGDYMARVFTQKSHSRVERYFYKTVGVNPDAQQPWKTYATSVLSFSAVSILFLYLLLRLQHWLPMAMGMKNVPPALSWNTAVSFITNTNW